MVEMGVQRIGTSSALALIGKILRKEIIKTSVKIKSRFIEAAFYSFTSCITWSILLLSVYFIRYLPGFSCSVGSFTIFRLIFFSSITGFPIIA